MQHHGQAIRPKSVVYLLVYPLYHSQILYIPNIIASIIDVIKE